MIPRTVEGIRTRILTDGSFMLPRAPNQVRQMLDDQFVRVKGELRWFEELENRVCLEDFKRLFLGEMCYLVGKGLSLDFLTSDHFRNTHAPVIAINEAIHKIETLNLPNQLFVIQQDRSLENRCLPKQAILIVSAVSGEYYSDVSVDKKINFRPEQFNATSRTLTVAVAINMAKSLGCYAFTLLCFDACVNNNLEYANCVGRPSSIGGDPQRFLTHKNVILGAVGQGSVNWVIPVSLDKVTLDSYLQSPSSLEAHREDVQVEPEHPTDAPSTGD